MKKNYTMNFAVQCLSIGLEAGALGVQVTFYHRSKKPWHVWKPHGEGAYFATIEEVRAYLQGVKDQGGKP